MTEPWKHRAACRDQPTEWWFPRQTRSSTTLNDDNRAAIAICKTCPVAAQCLAHAQRQPETHGIWGGLTSEERYRLTRKTLPRINHGTHNGYNRHIVHRQPPCDACREAHRQYTAALRRIRKRAQNRDNIEGLNDD